MREKVKTEENIKIKTHEPVQRFAQFHLENSGENEF